MKVGGHKISAPKVGGVRVGGVRGAKDGFASIKKHSWTPGPGRLAGNVTGQIERAGGTFKKPAGGIMGSRSPRDFALLGSSVMTANPIFGIYERSRRGGMTKNEALQNAGWMGSMYGDVRSDQKNRENRAVLDQQEKAAEQQTQDQLGQVDSNFGVGVNGAGNKMTMDKLFGDTTNAWLGNEQNDLQDNFSKALRTNRYNMADTGLSGSGPDADNQSGIFGTYQGARQGLFSKAAGIKKDFGDQAERQRLSLRSLISGGGANAADIESGLRQSNDSLQSAANNIPSQTFGNLFTDAANVYRSGTQAGAYGNQGLQAFNPTVSSSGGSRRPGSIT
jgi:hypothetical protein